MIIPALLRLLLLVLMVVIPIWVDFFGNSMDTSFRGLMRPVLASLAAAVVVILARTKNPIIDGDPQKVEVVAPAGKPLEVTETQKPVEHES